MNDAFQYNQPSWLYRLVTITFGGAMGFTVGLLVTVVFFSDAEPPPNVPDFEVAVPAKSTVSDLTVRPVEPAPAEADDPALSQVAILPEPPAEMPQIVPLPSPRPRSVPLPRPRPQGERGQARGEP